MWQLNRKRCHPKKTPFTSPNDIAVIIPTLNEAGHIESCIESLQGHSEISEIIVADGGSNDDTCRVAEVFKVQVVPSIRGRGLQVAQGIEASSADVCLIVHADCRLSEWVTAEIIRRLKDKPDAVGGALGMRFELDNPKMRLLSWLNNWRARITGLSFGDQGQFVRREALLRIGGYPRIPIMEDVELALRLKAAGDIIYIKSGITVSGRRWARTGFSANVFIVLRLLMKYLFERRWRKGNIDYQEYYRAYYGDKP